MNVRPESPVKRKEGLAETNLPSLVGMDLKIEKEKAAGRRRTSKNHFPAQG